MSRLALLILMLLMAVPALAQDDAKRVPGLVTELASEDWATRERASRELVGIGEPARSALRDALVNDDPEVRVRASNALIEIGEEFAYAVECAIAEREWLRDHGIASLMDLFRVADRKILRELTPYELQQRWGWGNNENLNILAPPVIALARLQALSGARLLVAQEAREAWDRVLAQPTANISLQGEVEQVAFVRDALIRWMQTAQGSVSVENQLVPRVLRIGRANLFYITRAGSMSGVARRCGEQLIADLLKEGEVSVHAASLLAEGASTDSAAADRIREQYVKRPDLTRLMWLAVALGADDDTTAKLRAREHAEVTTLLRSREWDVLELASSYLGCLEPAARGKLLSPIISSSQDAMELMAAVWIARQALLDEPARVRVGRLAASKQDVLAASAARWFAGASDITDAELGVIWQAGEFQPLDSNFFTAALELVQRPDIADRLVETARKSFGGMFDARVSRHALAAAVLSGRATAEDLATALDKLMAARAMPRLVAQMAELFSGCASLPDATLEKFQMHLFHSDVGVRRVYLVALRKCDSTLRVTVARGGVDARAAKEGAPAPPKHEVLARISLMGILAGAGDTEALDEIIKAVEGADAELAKAGGAAYADAFKGDAVFKALEDLNAQAGLVNGPLAALEGYLELCRQSVALRDRVLFRKAYGVAIGLELLNQNWQLRNELMQMQAGLGSEKSKAATLLPPDPLLKALTEQ